MITKHFKSNFNYYAYSFFKNYYFLKKREDSTSKKLIYIEKVCGFAFKNFSLLLADIDFEKELIAIGQEKLSEWNRQLLSSKQKENRNILHLATEIYEVGGHTRVINNWIKKDKKRNSFFILTNQKKETFIQNEISENTVETKILQNKLSHIEKCHQILEFIVRNKIDVVVFHTHPYDIIPVLISSISNFPYTILFNHSDHTFGLGALTSDLFLDLSKNGQKMSFEYRMIKKSRVLKLPINNLPKLRKTVSGKKITFVSMASAWKFKPFENLDFFGVYVPFLEKHKDVTLKIIGVNEAQYKEYTKLRKPENLELLGVISNPEKELLEADYFIEMFPFSSYLSALDSCSYGAMPIFNYDQMLINNSGTKHFFPFLEKENLYQTKNDYIRFLEKEVKTKEFKDEYLESIVTYLKDKHYVNWDKTIDSILGSPLTKTPRKLISKNKKINTERAKRYARFTMSANHFYWSDYIEAKFIIINLRLLFNFIFLFFVSKYIQYVGKENKNDIAPIKHVSK